MIPERARALFDVVRPVAELFDAADRRLYLVGGVVRDLFSADGDEVVRTDEDDVDLTTDAEPGEVKAIVGPVAEAMWTQGERFGTIGCKVGGVVLEITTHRAEAYHPDSRKPDVAFSDRHRGRPVPA